MFPFTVSCWLVQATMRDDKLKKNVCTAASVLSRELCSWPMMANARSKASTVDTRPWYQGVPIQKESKKDTMPKLTRPKNSQPPTLGSLGSLGSCSSLLKTDASSSRNFCASLEKKLQRFTNRLDIQNSSNFHPKKVVRIWRKNLSRFPTESPRFTTVPWGHFQMRQ